MIEPDLSDEELAAGGDPAGGPILDAHAMSALSVMKLARSMGAPVDNVTLVGCEPATLGPAEGQLGLSPGVETAVGECVDLVEGLVAALIAADTPADQAGPASP